MKCRALALAALSALPLCAQAQTRPVYTPQPSPRLLPYSRFAITPFVGARIPFNTGRYYVSGANGEQLLVDEQRPGAAAAGLNVDVALNRTFSLTAGAAFAAAESELFTYGSPTSTTAEGELSSPAPSMTFVKAGVTARIPDPIPDDRRFHPAAFVTVAPALVFTGSTAVQRRSTNFALNVGADATSRVGNQGFAIQIGLEDYVTFWNDDDFVARDLALFGGDPRFGQGPVAVSYMKRSPNILLARFGVSYRPARRAPARVPFVAPPPVAEAPAATPIRVCVVQGGQLAEVAATYSAERADTLVEGGRTLAQTYPTDALPYAASQPWFINNQPVRVSGHTVVKYGLARRLAPGDLRPAGEYQGVPLFASAMQRGTPDVFYIPVAPGCMFQPYQVEDVTGAVRGE